MKSKILGLSILLVLISLLFLVVVVSAATNFSVSTNSLSYEEPEVSKTFVITPTTTLNFTITTPTINDDDNNPIVFDVSGNLNNINSQETITLNATLDYDDLTIGDSYSGNLVVSDGTENVTIAVSFVPTFCKQGEASSSDFELSITEVDISNDDGDDEEWSPLDEITVEVEVSNEGDEKVKDVFVELGLLDPDGKNIVSDLDFSNTDEEEIDVGSIADGDEEKVEFKFEVPADFEADNYRLVVKAYGDDEGGDEVCVSKSSDLDKTYYHDIDGERETDEEDHIVVTNLRVSPETAQCGERVQVQGEVFNIGDDDYEDQVKVTLEINELGVDLEQVIREDFDQGDSSDVDFEFDVPDDADEKTYTVKLKTYYDYNDRHDVYEIVSDREFSTTFKVQGGCRDTPDDDGDVDGVSNVQITADFDPETPEAVPGKQVIIQATLRNIGSEQTTYSVSVSGNSAWSNLVAIDPQTLTLDPGESNDVGIILKVDDDAQGDQEFTIRVSYDGETTDQRVLVPIEEADAQGQAFAEHLAENWFIYLIVIINIILIIAIIAVVRRMLSPRPAM